MNQVQPEYFYWERNDTVDNSTGSGYAHYKMKYADYTARVKFDGSFLINGYDDRTSLVMEENHLRADLDWLIGALTELREFSKEVTDI